MKKSFIKIRVWALTFWMVVSFCGNCLYAETLDVVINGAVSHSDGLKIEYKNIEEAKSYLKLQYSNYFPKLTLQGTASADLLRLDDFDSDQDAALNVILDWDVFRNGQLLYSIATAKSSLVTAKIRHRVKEADVVFDTTRSYFELFLKTYEEINFKRSLDISRAEIEEANIAFAQGNIDRISLTKKKMKYADMEISYSQSKYNVLSLREKLKDKTKLDVEVNARAISELKDNALKVDFDAEALFVMALKMDADYLVKQESKKMSRLAKKYAKYKRYPQIQLFTGNSFALDNYGGSNNEVELRTGVIVRYPLYDGGQVKHEIQQAEKNYEKVKMEFTQYETKLKKDIEDLCFLIDKSRQILLLSEKKINLLEADIEHTEKEYERGDISQHKWNSVLLDYEEARLKDYTLQVDYLLAIAELFKKLGNFSLAQMEAFVSYKKKIARDLAT